MLVIVDNGKGSNEIVNSIRASKIVTNPKKFVEGSAYILSDGDLKNEKDNIKLINKIDKPILAIGSGYLFLASAFGAKIKKVPKTEKKERIMIKKPCPLVLDLKRAFEVFECYQHVISDLPENFGVIAKSHHYEFEIIQDIEKPFFGVHFCPEQGLDGRKVINNFVNFVDLWEKYHK
jgi:GMP synthase-like glutamine amidotransferase